MGTCLPSEVTDEMLLHFINTYICPQMYLLLTGRLNLSNQGLTSIPDIIWDPDALAAAQKKTVDVSFDRSGDTSWWEVTDLTRLNLADNAIEEIDPRIGELGGLIFLDIHNNRIRSLPEELSQLSNLSILNLGTNALTDIPFSVFELPLKELYLQGNNLTILPDEIGLCTRLTILDLSNNDLASLPRGISRLTGLTKLNISKNRLETLSNVNFSAFTQLTDLDCSNNSFVNLFGEATTRLPALQRLDLKYNKLTIVDDDVVCPNLKELYCGFNRLTSVGSKAVGIIASAVASLETLDMRDNVLEILPPAVLECKQLKRLDISNNSVGKLPPELGLLTGLNSLVFTGNPIRGLPTTGTQRLLKALRDRIVVAQPEEQGNSSDPPSSSSTSTSSTLPQQTMSAQEAATKTWDLSNKNLSDSDIRESDLAALPYIPSNVILHHNKLTRVPSALLSSAVVSALRSLVLHHNGIVEFPVTVVMPNLKVLDLSCNSISRLHGFPTTNPLFPSLIELNLNNNRIEGTFPAPSLSTPSPSSCTLFAFHFPKLTTILASDNRITEINVEPFLDLCNTTAGGGGMLQILDLSNNDVSNVPPRLGLCGTLRSLNLNGNSFRMPRRAILDKGTDAILAYLKDRIPTS
ncbi:hypothetical protein HK102_001014 [Quaeritorhiza haematococci]|nr:hypothetical protein HK102_001014 [Quaeritorhiza haematococci]